MTKITQAFEDYLKQIYQLQQRDGKVNTLALAERLNVSPASVTDMLKRLAGAGLVTHTPYYGAQLTAEGEKIALEVVRHHRLIELYLTERLGYRWDEVDQEADRLEHAISELMEERMDAALGYPTHDPHGDPIPTKEGYLEHNSPDSLAELGVDHRAIVRRVSDQNPEVLRYLGSLGIYPGVEVNVIEKAPLNGPLLVSVREETGQSRPHALSYEMASTLYVEPLQAHDEAPQAPPSNLEA